MVEAEERAKVVRHACSVRLCVHRGRHEDTLETMETAPKVPNARQRRHGIETFDTRDRKVHTSVCINVSMYRCVRQSTCRCGGS